MGLFDFLNRNSQKKSTNVQRNLSERPKEDMLKLFFEQQMQKAPSEHYASGSVFDISRQNRDMFLQTLQSTDCGSLLMLFVKAYFLFCNHPEVVGFTPDMVNTDNNDTDPRSWNADIFVLPDGDYAALLFMPIQHNTLMARIVGIVFSDNGDGYYYCMLNKDNKLFSEVFRNKAMFGIEKVGEVKGVGFELMHDFLDCIKHDYYQE